QSALAGGGFMTMPLLSQATPPQVLSTDSPFMVGPIEGYSPRVGTLLSTMRMMREMIFQQLGDLTVEQLDWHLDEEANSIGAMLWHLAATEKYYQLNTFEGIPWGEWDQSIKDEWDVAMSLGKPAREQIKGHKLDFYLDKLKSVRDATEAEFAKRDDTWLMESEEFFGPNLTNNHAKWFHVCEHESNHNGQIKFIKKRMPK
ncbi:MAG: DinB family protein, partial [Bacteroidota bacterium]